MTLSNLFDVLSGNINIVIILLFAVIPLYIGSAASTHSVNTINDYFLCNRSLGTLPLFFTTYATWWSTFAFISSTSSFYYHGTIYLIALGWNALFGVLLLVYGKRLWSACREFNYRTIIDYLDDSYQSKSLNTLSLIAMTAITIPYMMIQFVGGGIAIELATGSLFPWRLNVLIFFIIMIIYLWSGGLRSVVWTDTLYAVMILLGMLGTGYILTKIAGGPANIFATLMETDTDAFKLPDTINGIKGYGFWISLLILMPAGEIMTPQIWTRIFAVKHRSTFNVMPVMLSFATVAYIGSALAGSASKVLIPNYVGKSDNLLPTVLMNHTSTAVMGIIMCCIAAAALSTVNSQLHALSQIITLNFYKARINPNATERHTVTVAKVITLLIAIITYMLLILYDLTTIFGITLLAFGCVAQFIVPVTAALYANVHDSLPAISGIVTGIAITLLLAIGNFCIYPVHPSIIGLIANLAVFLIVNRVRNPKKKHALLKSLRFSLSELSSSMKVTWGLIISVFLLMGSPVVLVLSELNKTILGYPAISVYTISLWLLLCILCLIAYLQKWGDKDI